jgi:sugar lactone lactonase YvrE
MTPRALIFALALGAAAAFRASAAPPVPAIGTPTVLASGLAGPEGIAATRRGDLVVGTVTGDLIRIAEDGTQSTIASTGDRLAGVSVLRDDRIVACAFDQDRVWVVDTAGTPTVLASGIDGANFAAQERRRGRIFVSATLAGTIVDVTSGTPVVVAAGFLYPNGLAIRKERGTRFLYVAETLLHRVQRVYLNSDGTLGASEVYATGLNLVDGLAFDRRGNLLAVGLGALSVVDRDTRAVTQLSNAAPLNWPSDLAFGRRGSARRTLFLANFGPGLGDGTDVIAVPYSIRGASVIR